MSDVRKRKMARLFDVMDANGDGVLDESDYEAIAAAIAKLRGLGEGAPERAALRERYVKVFQEMRRLATARGATTVGRQDHLAFHEALLATADGFEAVPKQMVSFLFDALDADRDGVISLTEYIEGCRAYRIHDAAVATAAFRRLDTNSDGHLSHDEVVANVRDFYFSDAEDAPGNWLFGTW